MQWYWVVLITTLLAFCLYYTYRLGYRRGYKVGAEKVVRIWRRTLDDMEELGNE